MRNVSLAVQTYASMNADAIPIGIQKTSRFTAQSYLLPQLELALIYNQFGGFTGTADGKAATNIRIPILICPTDNPKGTYTSPGGGKYARSNFVLCFGADTMEPASKKNLGVFRVGLSSGYSTMFRDGASHTVVVCETVAGVMSTDPSGAWGYGEAGSSGYTHSKTPVSGAGLLPTVANSATDFTNAVATASSMHTGVVNVMFADNHGSAIATTIDPLIWQAMATPDGGEPFDSEKLP